MYSGTSECLRSFSLSLSFSPDEGVFFTPLLDAVVELAPALAFDLTELLRPIGGSPAPGDARVPLEALAGVPIAPCRRPLVGISGLPPSAEIGFGAFRSEAVVPSEEVAAAAASTSAAAFRAASCFELDAPTTSGGELFAAPPPLMVVCRAALVGVVGAPPPLLVVGVVVLVEPTMVVPSGAAATGLLAVLPRVGEELRRSVLDTKLACFGCVWLEDRGVVRGAGAPLVVLLLFATSLELEEIPLPLGCFLSDTGASLEAERLGDTAVAAGTACC